ncbi:uncharacterized protein LOC126553086 [Aphis gossypii]|uniref:uncharacterized protein LOC126553086 n=1 Tax=Aphis gossypii TaxID=80765 RepID=UPI002158A469|nr:uncharacterized protein LOC126553086 [Aphis gossypii]
MNKFVDSITIEEQDKLEELYARALYSSGTPLDFAEDSYWRQFFVRIRPAFKIPSRHIISNKLLDSEYARVNADVHLKMTISKNLSLQCDSWSNIRNEAIMNFIICTPSPVYYKSIATAEEKHTIITDNASAMLKATKILTTKYPHITSYGCAAHVLNLLIDDILKVSLCTSKVHNTTKQKSVTNISLKLPGKTRWGILAVTEGIENYLTPSVLESILNEDSFWLKIGSLISIFEVIVKWITLLEGDESKISLVVEAFYEIELNWQTFLNSDIITIEEKDQLNTSNILDPAYNGVHLSNNEQVLGTEYIDQKSTDICPNNSVEIMAQLAEYRCKEGFFSNSYVFKSVDKLSPTVWWKGTCFCLNLSAIALAILEMPPTTAATERSFSIQGFIHSSKRNRLTTERAAKLTFISHNLKIMKRKEYNKCSSQINNVNSQSPNHENTLNNEYGYQQNITHVSKSDTDEEDRVDTDTTSSPRFNCLALNDESDSFNFSLNGDDISQCNNDNIYSNESLLNILNIASTSKSNNSSKIPLQPESNNLYISTPKKPVSKKSKFNRLIILSDDEEFL